MPALEWFDTDDTLETDGDISFGQTHVIRESESRWAPDLIAERATMLLFEPDADIASDAATIYLAAPALALALPEPVDKKE